jgi:integrase
LRRNEALGLRREDIDYAQHIMYLNKTKVKKFRAVPLNTRAMEILSGAGDDVFRTLNKQDVTRKFAYYLKKGGLEGFKLHSLRHTFATMLVSRGVDIYHVSKLLGHSDIRTTMIYGKASVEALRMSVEKLNALGS